MKAKRSRKRKYKTEKERKAAHAEAQMRYWAKRNPPPPPETLPPSIENRLAALEKENKDILADLEECLKENRELKNLIKWGRAK